MYGGNSFGTRKSEKLIISLLVLMTVDLHGIATRRGVLPETAPGGQWRWSTGARACARGRHAVESTVPEHRAQARVRMGAVAEWLLSPAHPLRRAHKT